jgi:hypothetical protein
VVFCDGHVESPTLPFLFADTSDYALSGWNRDQPTPPRTAGPVGGANGAWPHGVHQIFKAVCFLSLIFRAPGGFILQKELIN